MSQFGRNFIARRARMHEKAQELEAAIAVVCPVEGVSIGRWQDKGSWRIFFAAGASEKEKTNARKVLYDFDPGELGEEDVTPV